MAGLGAVKCYIELEPIDAAPDKAVRTLRQWWEIKHEQPLWVTVRTDFLREKADGLIHRTCTLYPDLPEVTDYINMALDHGCDVRAVVVEGERFTLEQYAERYGFTPPEARPVLPEPEQVPDSFPGFQTGLEIANADFKFRDETPLRKRKRKA